MLCLTQYHTAFIIGSCIFDLVIIKVEFFSDVSIKKFQSLEVNSVTQ